MISSSDSMGNCRSKKNDSVDIDGDNCNKMNENNDINRETSQNNLGINEEIKLQNSKPQADSTKKKTNIDVIDTTKVEVCALLEKIEEFGGTSEDDKNYRYVDEMLTRCILKLDQLDCNNASERISRKNAITDVNQAITILERKLEFNADVRNLENKLSK